jgi:hypothetical protein
MKNKTNPETEDGACYVGQLRISYVENYLCVKSGEAGFFCSKVTIEDLKKLKAYLEKHITK